MEHEQIGVVESTGLVVDLETPQQLSMTIDDGYVRQVVKAQGFLDIGDDMRIVLGIVGRVGRAGLHHPARHAIATLELEINRHPLVMQVVFLKGHLAIEEACRGAVGGPCEIQGGGHQLAHHRRNFQHGVDVLAGLGKHRQLPTALK